MMLMADTLMPGSSDQYPRELKIGNWRFWSRFFDWGVWQHRNQNLTKFPDVVFNSGNPIQDLPLFRLFARCYLLV